PVSALSLICAHGRRNAIDQLNELLRAWEKWAAELVESHVSYPMLSYYRSEHSDQSWLTATAVVMDTCALRIAGITNADEFQAEATMSICTNALRSISQILNIEAFANYEDRLTPGAFEQLLDRIRKSHLPVGDQDTWERLSDIRRKRADA